MNTENTARSAATTQDGESSADRRVARVVTWHEDRGFGFLRPTVKPSGERDFFVHRFEIQRTPRQLSVGEMVTFFVGTDPQGRRCAVNVAPEGVQP